MLIGVFYVFITASYIRFCALEWLFCELSDAKTCYTEKARHRVHVILFSPKKQIVCFFYEHKFNGLQPSLFTDILLRGCSAQIYGTSLRVLSYLLTNNC